MAFATCLALDTPTKTTHNIFSALAADVRPGGDNAPPQAPRSHYQSTNHSTRGDSPPGRCSQATTFSPFRGGQGGQATPTHHRTRKKSRVALPLVLPLTFCGVLWYVGTINRGMPSRSPRAHSAVTNGKKAPVERFCHLATGVRSTPVDR